MEVLANFTYDELFELLEQDCVRGTLRLEVLDAAMEGLPAIDFYGRMGCSQILNLNAIDNPS